MIVVLRMSHSRPIVAIYCWSDDNTFSFESLFSAFDLCFSVLVLYVVALRRCSYLRVSRYIIAREYSYA